MASEYSVNISLDTKQAEAGLKKLRTQINDLNKPTRTTKTTRQEEKIAKLKEAQRVSMIQTRKIGDQVQRAADSGLKVDKARAAIRRAAKADSAGLVKLADANRKSALSELKINQEITKEKTKQINLLRQLASPIQGTRTMMGSPTQLGFAGAGMGRSSLRGNRFQFGSPAFFEAGARAGGASSPLLGTRFDFGSPAQMAFSGGPSSPILGSKTTFGSPRFFDAAARAGGASSPLLGSKTTFGSPKFFEASAKAGGPSIPIKGSKDIYGSPAYYDATNKEALRIAKSNAMPIKGFKHLVGSPAYFEDQAKQFKKVDKQAIASAPSSALNFDKRTGKLLRGPAGSGGRGFKNLARRFDTQSALISGAFPLLFGQGPVGALAGGLGGGIGGMFGQMGGFAGGIAATAVVQQIQAAIKAISDLGQAMGPFTQNTEAVIAAVGLQGSAEEERIKLIEQSQGKQAAFNASMTTMTALIGQKGVDSLKDFGETTRLMNSQFTLAIAKIQAFTSRLINFVIQLTGLEDGLTTAAATQSVAIAAAEGDSVAQDLVARRKALSGMSGQGGSGIRRKQLENEIIKEERLFAIRRNTSIEADKITATFDGMVNKINQEEELSQRILELRRDGLNPEIAKTIAKLEEEADKSKDSLQIKIDELKRKKEAGNLDKRALTELEEKISNLEKEKDAVDNVVDSTKDQVKAQHDLTNAAKQTLDAFDKMKTTIQGDIKDGIKGLIKGTSTLGDLLNNVADRFLDLALNQALFGNAGGETVTGGLFKAIGFKAKGGPVRGGSSYVVGERGPELFTPGVSGNITPNNQMGGSTSVVVNVDASGTSAEGDQASGEELGRLIGAAVQAELIKERRPGGLLG